MRTTFSDLRARQARGENGFTLIELLVVVVILGVLIAIAIPVYLNYRKGANDAAVQSDMRNGISTLEACSVSDGKYPVQTTAIVFGSATDASSVAPCATQRYTTSKGSTIKYQTNSSGTCYVLVGTNAGGASKYWIYNSTTAGSVAPSNVTAYSTPPTC